MAVRTLTYIESRFRRSLVTLMVVAPAFMPGAPPGGKGSGHGTRIYFGPAYGFYAINKNHAKTPIQRMSLCAGFKREVRLDRTYKTWFLFGAEYFLHGLSFKSYYFKPDSVQLYDKSFRFTYNNFFHELVFPVQFKYLFRRADNKLFSPYIAGAYQIRALLPGDLKVRDASGQVKADKTDVRFRHPLLSDKLNSGVQVSLGWQKNAISSSRGAWFVELAYRYGFSPYFFEADYAPSSLYVNSTHLILSVGARF
jgi:hypothetical protein